MTPSVTAVMTGIWPAIIDEPMFREVQERRAYRSAANREQYEQRKFYLLRGLLWCTKCGVRMSGPPVIWHWP